MTGDYLEVSCPKCKKVIYLQKGIEFNRPCQCVSKVIVQSQGRNAKRVNVIFR